MMETAEEIERRSVTARRDVAIQPCGYLLELSADWIVLRASENIHHLLGESHVTLIDEPLGRFVHSQALHDLRNLFSRLSGTTGIGRAYGVRLTDAHQFVDVSFQLSHGRVLFEAISSEGQFGESFGTVGGLVAGLGNSSGQALLDGGARRMRALTGYDRVTVTCGEHRAESSRGSFPSPAELTGDLPPILFDTEAAPVQVYPRRSEDSSLDHAIIKTADEKCSTRLRKEGVRALINISFSLEDVTGGFRCDSRTPRKPDLELHAAAELFAQLFAMRLKIDRLRTALLT